ncbi:MAG: sulfatase-like hydrolase/transferase [Planctomycetes bacterium]|nr:sulfatase-like hydrolase/transferase [Planctomycetota bacterium]
MRRLTHAAWVAGLVSTVLCPSIESQSTRSQSTQSRPNVLFIAIDDLRPELGCYGSQSAITPHLDELAAEGLRFDRAYCQYPICGASRASLLSGLYPTRSRFLGLDPLDKYEPDAVTLPQTFKEQGYTTISNGKIFHSPDDADARSWSEPAWRPAIGPLDSLDPATREQLSRRRRGYIVESPDVPDDAYFDGKVAEKTIADLQRLRDAGRPFFLACGFVRPHLPFYAPRRYWDLHDRDGIPIADNRFAPKDAPKELRGSREYDSYYLGDLEPGSDTWHHSMRHGYLASTSYTDALVGRVLTELARLGLADNTIVVVWGDHGWHLGEHDFWGKHNTLDNALRIPLIIRLPRSMRDPAVAPGQATAAMVESVDIYPTLCELTGITPPEVLQGRSFTHLFTDPAAEFRDAIYARFGADECVVTGCYAYTRYTDPDGPRMLFDHRNDPLENQNVAADPAYAVAVSELDGYLDERIRVAEGGAASKDDVYDPAVPAPTLSEVAYGPHERNVLDFWRAGSESPSPVVMVIHGGGWRAGSKERVQRFVDVRRLLDAGISVAAIDYRFTRHGVIAGLEPPVQAPLHDAARALQFIRSRASDWGIDAERIGLAGGSAGACSSLWLAFHDDLAEPDSDDPVARQSTRPWCAAVIGAQTSLDPRQMKAWTPNSRYGAQAFGYASFADWLEAADRLQRWFDAYSPYALVSAGDAPVYLFYTATPGIGEPQRDPTHTSNFGVMLQRQCEKSGVECEVVYPGAAGVSHQTATDYLIASLR